VNRALGGYDLVMRVADIKAHLRRQPFQPVRIGVSDQSHIDIRHPELVLVGKTEITIGLPDGESDVYERLMHVDPVHITPIETLPPKGKSDRSSRRRPKR